MHHTMDEIIDFEIRQRGELTMTLIIRFVLPLIHNDRISQTNRRTLDGALPTVGVEDHP